MRSIDEADGPTTVTRRRVYYLAGFDTRSARAYHQMYRDEALRQQAINGCCYEVGDSFPSGEHGWSWTVRSTDGGGPVDTTYSFLAWNDVVHAHWPRSTLRVAWSAIAVYLELVAKGQLARTRQLSRPFFWMMVLPLFYTAFALLLAVAGGMAGAFASGAIGAVSAAGAASIVQPAGAVLGAAMGLWLGLWLAEHQRVYWLLRAWAFILAWGRERIPQLPERWEAFARRIEQDRVADPADETLIVGHSAGAMSAVSVAAHWLALQPAGAVDPRVKLMTIGSAVPMLGLAPEAGWFRAQLRRVGESGMPWTDFTAPADPLCYALVDPFKACGMDDAARAGYRLRSARFDRMFSPATYRRVRGDFFRIHFQYLCATDQPVANDWFTLTAGARALRSEPSA